MSLAHDTFYRGPFLDRAPVVCVLIPGKDRERHCDLIGWMKTCGSCALDQWLGCCQALHYPFNQLGEQSHQTQEVTATYFAMCLWPYLFLDSLGQLMGGDVS